ncbi:MAG: YggS family pyridoxal phosphate-dependent enzyme [Candidatus Aminicenantaceae bacterium]
MIRENVKKILSELPEGVHLVAAAKSKSPDEVLEAVEAGIKIIGENYIQEALDAFKLVGNRVKWHFIGHLQTNKAKKAIEIFDMIETVDSFKIAKEIDKRAGHLGKFMPVLVEINSGREPQKYGILPEDAEHFIKEIAAFEYLKIKGLMTMGPAFGNPEEARPYFVETKKIFERMKSLSIPNTEMKYLSMGMTNSYKVAIEEGANLVRIGTKIFGQRE